MNKSLEVKKSAGASRQLYHRGQHIIYKGEHAQVMEVNPVFTIRIEGKSHVICGNNILGDVRPATHGPLARKSLYGTV